MMKLRFEPLVDLLRSEPQVRMHVDGLERALHVDLGLEECRRYFRLFTEEAAVKRASKKSLVWDVGAVEVHMDAELLEATARAMHAGELLAIAEWDTAQQAQLARRRAGFAPSERMTTIERDPATLEMMRTRETLVY